MKTIVIIALLAFVSIQSVAQINQEKALYLQKVTKYTQMRKTGTFLTIAGGVLFTAGIITLANSSYNEVDYGNGNVQTYTEGSPGAGIALYLVGTAGLASGIPLWIIGKNNQRKYEEKLQTVSFKLKASPNNMGVALTYRF